MFLEKDKYKLTVFPLLSHFYLSRFFHNKEILCLLENHSASKSIADPLGLEVMYS